MLERATTAACLLMTSCCLLLLGLVWHQSNQATNAAADITRRFAADQVANQKQIVELLAQSQATNAALLKQLQSIARPAPAPTTPSGDWIPVSFKLTFDTIDGPPAVGYEVILDKSS
jgi:hypothetical protein